MGKKNKQKYLSPVETFPFRSLILYFLLFFVLSMLVLLAITPLLSMAKLNLIRWLVRLILRTKTPYIHPIPLYQNLSMSLAVFSGLFFAYRKVDQKKRFPLKKEFIKPIFCLMLLWFLEIITQVLYITVTKLEISAFLPNFLLTIFLSIGSIVFPILIWLLFFHPSFLD
jgi:hypothetical protein